MLTRVLGAALLLASTPLLAFAQIQPDPVYKPPPPSSGNAAADSSKSVNEQWSNLLGNALYFFDIQRSGQLPPNFRVDWRNDSVLGDGKDVGIDLSGGFFDAGNYIKVRFFLVATRHRHDLTLSHRLLCRSLGFLLTSHGAPRCLGLAMMTHVKLLTWTRLSGLDLITF